MAYNKLPVRTSQDANSPADINLLQSNLDAVVGGDIPLESINGLAGKIVTLETGLGDNSFTVSTGETVTVDDIVEMINDGTIRTKKPELSAKLPVVFESAFTQYISAVALSDSNVLVAYQDGGNSNFGTARVLSITNTVITFGTEVIFESAGTAYISATALSGSKVLVAYQDIGNSNAGTARVLTITGAAITFAAEAVFESANTQYISAVALSSSKVLVAYAGTARVLTITGAAISTPSPAVSFDSGVTSVSASILPQNNVLVAYARSGSFSYARVLTITGTVISTPSPAVSFDSGVTNVSVITLSDYTSLVVYYKDSSSSICARVLSITGTVITTPSPAIVVGFSNYSSIVALSDTMVVVFYISTVSKAVLLTITDTEINLSMVITFKQSAVGAVSAVALSDNKVIFAYRDDGNANYGTANIVELKQYPVIGIAKETKTAGQQCIVADLKKKPHITMVQDISSGSRYYEMNGVISLNKKNQALSPYINRVFTPKNLIVGVAIDTHKISIDNIIYGGSV